MYDLREESGKRSKKPNDVGRLLGTQGARMTTNESRGSETHTIKIGKLS